jgi:quercetin dioxygenase-like cupin family protein
MSQSRRDLALLVPALLAAARSAEGAVLPSKCYSYDALQVKTSPDTHNESRQVFDGETHKGMQIDLHLTKLAAGQMPHPEHHHTHEELVVLISGQLEVTIAGRPSTIHTGSIAYVASNEVHGWKNTGTVPAEYAVLALGRD